MRLYDNPLMALAYLLGSGGKGVSNKLQNTLEKRDERKMVESWIDHLSDTDEKTNKRNQRAERLEKWAVRSLITCLIGLPLAFVFLLFSSPVALVLYVIDLGICVVAMLFGLYYSLWGKYL